MRFDVITLFPELFAPFLTVGINRRAFEAKDGISLVDVRLWNPRDFAQGTYRRIDDRPFGGGPDVHRRRIGTGQNTSRRRSDYDPDATRGVNQARSMWPSRTR